MTTRKPSRSYGFTRSEEDDIDFDLDEDEFEFDDGGTGLQDRQRGRRLRPGCSTVSATRC